jgi:choline dehydrogenase
MALASTTWDYIVVGAGSAGCVLADRLTEVGDATVLLIEAGGSDLDLRVQLPVGLFRLPPSMDWAYDGDPDASMNGRVNRWAAGKVLGGGSSVNGMIWVRGAAEDYDEWAKLGAAGWGYDDVLPYFRRSESFVGGEDEYRGANGPQRVDLSRVSHPMNDAFILAATQVGARFNEDYNGRAQLGAARVQVSQRRGLRWSTARGYLARARRRPNLTVLTDTTVRRIVIEDGRATGVEVTNATGGVDVLRAREEVVLSAGAIGSPKLLMISGIGPGEHLREVGVDVVRDSPEVGTNLQEHPCSPLILDVNVRTLNQEFNPVGFVKHGLDFVLRGRGGATATAAQAVWFGRFDGAGTGRPDFQVMFGPYGVEQAEPRKRRAPKPGPEAKDSRNVVPAKNATVRALICVLHPSGRGTVTLRSGDPQENPRISRGLYEDPRDLERMVSAVRMTRQVAAAPALGRFVTGEKVPGASASSDDELIATLRSSSYGGQHPIGTVRMGSDEAAPVDPTLRVRGIAGLRVADASVMPTLVSGNTNAAAIMIGERAADLILAAR